MEHLQRLAAAQHGLVTRRQLVDRGLAEGTIDGWARGGRLLRVHPGVFALPGSAGNEIRSVMAAVLAAGAGALASHRSAAWLWGLMDELTLEVSVSRQRRPRVAGVVVHRPQDFAQLRSSVSRGVPATNPLRTLVDLGSVAAPDRVEEAVERALVRRLVGVRGLSAELDRVSCPGRPGVAALRKALRSRALLDRPPDSMLESRFAALLRRHGVPRAVYQYAVRSGGRFIARVDFAYPECRLAVEVDGHEAHRTPAQLQSDLTRQNLLVAEGWTILRFTWADVVQRPDMVADAIRRQLARLPRI